MRALEEARMDLTRSATAYSARARQVVDGTMSLSAVLMRAGEVGEAERLLAETERDVREEKRVLLESVQEAKVARHHRREKMSRLRLAKMVATAALGGSVFVFSAVGMAAAKYFSDRFGEAQPSVRSSAILDARDGRLEVSPARRVRVALGSMQLDLSQEEYEEFRRLVSSDDPERLRSFLLRLIPSGLAGQLDHALAQAGITAPVRLADVETAVENVAHHARPEGSSNDPAAPSSGDGGGSSQGERSSNKQERGDPDEKEDSSAGSSGCEEEDDERGDGEGQNGLNVGPLDDGCVPVLEEEVSGD